VAAAILAAPPDSTGLAQSGFCAAANGQRLDDLFGPLKPVKDEREVEAAVAEIWKVLLQSGRPELDEAMSGGRPTGPRAGTSARLCST
jgi:hypothetical protein